MEEQAYIAAYFEGTLPEEARAGFEARCLNDPLFAAEVANYVIMRDALREELYQHKRERFAGLYQEMAVETAKRQPYFLFKNLVGYAAAACIALIAAWLIFFGNKQPEDLANAYAATHFKQLGITMGAGEQERMQQGIAAFNKGRYTEASHIFKTLTRDSSLKAEAVKNLGITQLMAGDEAGAIASFDALAGMDLFTNPGLFYKAIALMRRSGPADTAAARKCLKEVVEKNLPGKSDAEDWLKKL
jgi:hypothetical protein